jgi:ABC-2 type transport system permease protein
VTNFLALTRRELGVYFVSPVAYIILTAILFISGLSFTSSMEDFAQNRLPVSFQPTLQWIMGVVLLTSALITMRLIAEEKTKGTLEIVLTAPVTETQFVLAKFAAAMTLLVYLVLLTVGYALIIAQYGQVDWGAVACGYLGVLLVGAVTYSIGIFISSLCTSQVTAGMVTFALNFVLIIVGVASPYLQDHTWWQKLLHQVNLIGNFMDFMKGVVDVGRLVFLLSMVVFALFLTVRVVESRRWR